ncbi:MAG: MogA/MoaB family molybdenum cofactor biosynthesis protein [Anaerolineales bacterium]|nr:MogA/MoaB family molybdenum cofactor biosynthesis protein [Anaerolineales bacterium]
MRIAVLTISDRSARGESEDRSGPRIQEIALQRGWEVIASAIIPDEQVEIEERLASWSDSDEFDLILTTGGTGFSPRDRTPEATRKVVDRLAPGLAEAMRVRSMSKTPHAMLSRAVAGIRKRTLIVNLPGSPKAAEENLAVIIPALPHAIQLLREDPEAEQGHHLPPPHRTV